MIRWLIRSSSSSSSSKPQPFYLYALIFSLLLLLLVSSSELNVINSDMLNFVTVQHQQQQPVKNQTNNTVHMINDIAKKLGRGKMRFGLVNVDRDYTQLLHGLEDVEPIRVNFDRVSADRKWDDFFREWIDEDETWGRPKCPEIPMPKFQDYENIDVILAKIPCGTIRGGENEGVRDVFRLQVNLVVASGGSKI